MGGVTKTNEIRPDVADDEKGRYSDIPHKYKFLLNAPFRISSNCCKVMKKQPMHRYNKETGRVPITGQMAEESRLRTIQWLRNGCSVFEGENKISNPMSFWTEQDVLRYIKEHDIKIASIYGSVVYIDEKGNQYDEVISAEGVRLCTTRLKRTGCMFCGYGCQLEKGESRFEAMKKTHPKQYNYIMKPWEEGGLNYKYVIDWMNENGNMDIKY